MTPQMKTKMLPMVPQGYLTGDEQPTMDSPMSTPEGTPTRRYKIKGSSIETVPMGKVDLNKYMFNLLFCGAQLCDILSNGKKDIFAKDLDRGCKDHRQSDVHSRG